MSFTSWKLNNSPSGNVAINDPLTPGVANGPFTSGLDHPITLQSNMSGGNPASPNPRGTSGLRLWNSGSGSDSGRQFQPHQDERCVSRGGARV